MPEPHSRELHLVQLELEIPSLLALGRDQGWQRAGSPRWSELGYAVHAQLSALFADLAPQPFWPLQPFQPKGRWLTVLGYAPATANALRQTANEFALPATYGACRWQGVQSRPVPTSIFQAGRQLGFELRVCPVVRLASDTEGPLGQGRATFRAGAEVDAYVHRRWLVGSKGEPESGRESIYARWLEERLGAAANSVDTRLKAFRRVRLLRRAQSERGRRQAHTLERPDALLTGILEVADSEAFRTLLSRGVGRHRTFGFGMLLLRPPGSRT